MCEAEQTRVQGLPRKCRDSSSKRPVALNGASGARAIDRIADQGMTPMSKMHADLMCSACAKTAFDECRLRAERALDTIMRNRGLSPAFRDNSHLFAVGGAAADVAGDLSCERSWHTPNYCGISAIDSAQHEIPREGVVGGLGLGDDHQPARILIEAMNDTRPADPADPGKTHPAMADQGVYERAVRVSRRGVDNQARGLIDDDQMCVLEADIQSNRLPDRRCIYIIRANYDEFLAASDSQRRVAQSCSFAGDIAVMDQPFEPGARQRREMAGKRPVKALPGLTGAGEDSGRDAAKRGGFSRHDRAFCRTGAKSSLRAKKDALS